MNEILNPNCSEECFRLSGNLKDIKTEVLKMLDLIGGNRKKLREKIKNITNLNEFENIVFEFTCNYPTYFKEEDGGLLVATCNNHSWEDSVNFDYEDTDRWDEIANENYYKLIFKEKNCVIAEQEYGNKKLVFLEVEEIKFEYDKTFKLIEKKGVLYIVEGNGLVKVKEIKDENLKNKLGILARL